mmetsp:Transcript_26149/g.26380  ORF Transcript_26149/g.26380 Transcript_26149/m.26380 type:complete len:136 (+) Transcript_26149:218-625(+)
MRVLLSVFISFIFLLSIAATGKKCTEEGKCEACLVSEMDYDYCRETGRKIKLVCHERSSGSVKVDSTTKENKPIATTIKEDYYKYKSCTINGNDITNIVIFQISMAVVGGLAYWGVQTRRINAMSQFDHRKLSGK